MATSLLECADNGSTYLLTRGMCEEAKRSEDGIIFKDAQDEMNEKASMYIDSARIAMLTTNIQISKL